MAFSTSAHTTTPVETSLWKTDGSDAGTVRVADIGPGSVGSFLTGLTNVGGTLYFRAFDGTSGDELWKSDGTEAGTVRVADIRPGAGRLSSRLTHQRRRNALLPRERWRHWRTNFGKATARKPAPFVSKTFGPALQVRIPGISQTYLALFTS